MQTAVEIPLQTFSGRRHQRDCDQAVGAAAVKQRHACPCSHSESGTRKNMRTKHMQCCKSSVNQYVIMADMSDSTEVFRATVYVEFVLT